MATRLEVVTIPSVRLGVCTWGSWDSRGSWGPKLVLLAQVVFVNRAGTCKMGQTPVSAYANHPGYRRWPFMHSASVTIRWWLFLVVSVSLTPATMAPRQTPSWLWQLLGHNAEHLSLSCPNRDTPFRCCAVSSRESTALHTSLLAICKPHKETL